MVARESASMRQTRMATASASATSRATSKAIRRDRMLGLGGLAVVAVDHNLLLVATLPVVIGLTAYWAYGRFVTPTTSRRRLPGSLAWGFFALAIAFALVRNLPWAPFTYLASDAS